MLEQQVVHHGTLPIHEPMHLRTLAEVIPLSSTLPPEARGNLWGHGTWCVWHARGGYAWPVRTARRRLARVACTYWPGVCVSAWAGTRHSAARAGRRAPPRPRGTTARRHCRQCTSPAAAPLLRGGSRCLPAACPRDSWAGARAPAGIGSRRRRRRADGRRPLVRRALAAERGAPSFAGGAHQESRLWSGQRRAKRARPLGWRQQHAEVRTVRNLTAPTPLSKTQHDPKRTA